jgi:hypothetical protein
MKTITDFIPETTIEEFAERYNFTMVIRERRNAKGTPERYYACFLDAEVKEGRFLSGAYGNGATPEEAIKNYAARISEQTLVFHAWTDRRMQMEVPRLVAE